MDKLPVIGQKYRFMPLQAIERYGYTLSCKFCDHKVDEKTIERASEHNGKIVTYLGRPDGVVCKECHQPYDHIVLEYWAQIDLIVNKLYVSVPITWLQPISA